MNATMKKKGLGRGLEALLGGSSDITEAVRGEGLPNVLRLDSMQAGKYQPRTRMDEGALQELAASIRAQGVMQPILVRSIGGERYEIIAGERRFRAAKLAGLEEVPVLVKNVPDQAAAAMALIENIQREDLNPLEEAQGIQRLLDEFDFTHEQAAESVGRSRSAVSNLLRLLNLATPVQTMLLAGDLDMGHARALLAVDAATQIQLANQVVNKRMSVRETEKLVSSTTKEVPTTKARAANDGGRDTRRLEEELSDLLSANVKIKMGGRGRGKLQIDFGDLDALEGILGRLRTGVVNGKQATTDNVSAAQA
ncbi:ParB/RepB/Spo0J family partition protein [Caballeronia mineralivorans]|jgi:ParB family chromosome partitioning protein|uniref:ParB/RepB/Spo0J family partition protein n=1 Tax=Caballeronia mineralivorans TaxID=2010198 RepID=UPI0023EFAE52|nr:ParB/RepB/Spo0J family partition protein [Caballeronia mineralivorans]MDB5784534.1 chromosome partitioning protein ParB [Caballeronia mineralivorans]MEA3102198.1 ParB family transcriptional regulator, chromosome partitioning protein [Caballeronia mineralivorans]